MSRVPQPGGVWMLDEACGVLRELPARSWSLWLAGTLPFTWLLIDYLMEMSISAFAEERLVGRSLLLAVLYVAKHSAHALFAWDCVHTLRGDSVARPHLTSIVRLALVQSAFQPLRFLFLPVASLVLLPFPWCAAFFRNIGLSAIDRPRGFVQDARSVSASDVRSHSVALGVLFLCWLLLFLNLFSLWFILPMLLKAFFGIETEFTRLAQRLLNINTFLVTAILTTTAIEPVICALAAVRAFYARARAGGDDLRGALRRLAAAAVLLAILVSPSLRAQAEPPPQLQQAELDRKIDDVLHQPEFAWRLPKAAEDPDITWLTKFFQALGNWVEWIVDLLKRLFPEDPPPARRPGGEWQLSPAALRAAMIAAAVLAAGAIVYILLSRQRSRTSKTAKAVAVPVAAVDLADETISAGQRAEDEWLRMADECAAQGEFRLGMRALHLAGLRYLGEKGWVTLQPAKTGLEYGDELARRLRHVPPATTGYSTGLRQFEGVWYGFGEAGPASYQSLRSTWEELRRYA